MSARRKTPAAPQSNDHRRAMCAWIGALAAHRAGLLGRLVRAHDSVPRLLERNPRDLAASLARATATPESAAADPAAGEHTVPAATGSAAADQHPSRDAFHAILHLPPEELFAALQKHGRGHTIITWHDELYPPRLRHLPDPPLCLFARHECDEGELERRMRALAMGPAVAVVGTRSPSVYGEEMAALLGRDLAVAGLAVVSGLAMGIDAIAQAAAVEVGRASDTLTTVAVLGCGPDVVYPRVNASLRREISRRGLLLSEFPWGSPARPWRFPARNRLMAALSQAVVIVEGGRRSGTRLTADFALDLGREVLAVPGEAGRRLTAAPHALLRQGASLCESAADILDAIPVRPEAPHPATDAAHAADGGHTLGDEKCRLLGALGDAPMPVDRLAERLGLSVSSAAAAVSELEIDGLVRLLPGGTYRLTSRD